MIEKDVQDQEYNFKPEHSEVVEEVKNYLWRFAKVNFLFNYWIILASDVISDESLHAFN